MAIFNSYVSLPEGSFGAEGPMGLCLGRHRAAEAGLYFNKSGISDGLPMVERSKGSLWVHYNHNHME